MSKKIATVKYEDESPPIPCPYGDVRRIVTGGEGWPVANVHVVRVTSGGWHDHAAYDETYYVLEGHGEIRLGAESFRLRPGAVVTIPAGVAHSLDADDGETLAFVIFGTPGMDINELRARPRRATPPVNHG